MDSNEPESTAIKPEMVSYIMGQLIDESDPLANRPFILYTFLKIICRS
ncbi:MAG: hypothetical protein V4492_00380 [Chlamydiota bacterium]